MSLMEEAMEKCAIMDKVRVEDGYGGFITRWQETATFDAAIGFDNSIQARVAKKEGVTDVYTITTHRNTTLSFHDVIKRKSDGQIFRITSNGKDKKTPASAGLDMRVVTAEAWELPADETENA